MLSDTRLPSPTRAADTWGNDARGRRLPGCASLLGGTRQRLRTYPGDRAAGRRRACPIENVRRPTYRRRIHPEHPGGPVQPDSARELKARILAAVEESASAQAFPHDVGERRPHVAVGLTPAAGGVARVAVRLETEADRGLLPDLGRVAAAQLDVRVIGPVRPLSSPTPGELQQRVRPLRPGLSVAHPSVSAGTLGGFVRVGGRLALLSNNHVIAASDAAAIGDAVLQP